MPQQYFEHFYLVGSLVTTVLLQVYIFVCTPDTDGSTLKVPRGWGHGMGWGLGLLGAPSGRGHDHSMRTSLTIFRRVSPSLLSLSPVVYLQPLLQRDSLLALFLFELHVLRRYGESNYVMHYPESEWAGGIHSEHRETAGEAGGGSSAGAECGFGAERLQDVEDADARVPRACPSEPPCPLGGHSAPITPTLTPHSQAQPHSPCLTPSTPLPCPLPFPPLPCPSPLPRSLTPVPASPSPSSPIPAARMHLLAYLFGLSYYVVAPLTLLPAFVMDVGVLRGAWDQVGGEAGQGRERGGIVDCEGGGRRRGRSTGGHWRWKEAGRERWRCAWEAGAGGLGVAVHVR